MIKGLQIFINDIRDCTTKEAEAKRVDKELDKVRKKLNTKNALTGYEKKKCIWKLLYIHILGYKIDFGLNYSCDLITSIKYSEKMAGYIAMSILFKDTNADVDVMINSIKNDLFNKNAFSQSMALTLACNLENTDLLNSFADPVFEIIDKELLDNDDNVEKDSYIDEIKYGKYRDMDKLDKSFVLRGIDKNKI